jgi:hypothetical protein
MPTFSQQVNWATTMWRSNVARPYIQAYNEAYKSVQASLKAEEDEAKAQAELFASIVAILPASVLMAVVTAPAFQRAIKKIAVRRLGAANLRTTLGYLKPNGKHPVVAFAFGKAADIIKDSGSKQVKDLLTNLVQNTAGGVSATDPLSRSQELLGMVETQGMMVERAGTAILEDRTMNAGVKQALMSNLMSSPFMANKPEKKLDWQQLRPSIELAMLMNVVLDRDYLMRHGPIGTRIPAERVPGGISAMPSDPEYPKSQAGSAMAFYNTVEVDRPSNSVQEHIDRVHKEVYKVPFYTHGRYLGMQWPGGKAEELVRAEAVLKKLSKPALPRALGDVRFA